MNSIQHRFFLFSALKRRFLGVFLLSLRIYGNILVTAFYKFIAPNFRKKQELTLSDKELF